jgi:hypothetical protein
VIEPRAPFASSRHTRQPNRTAPAPTSGISRISVVALVLVVGLLLISAFCAQRVAAYRPLQRSASSGQQVEAAHGGGEQPAYAWRGAVHVHSTRSDGAGSVEDVIEAAQEAGLDFLILSDHNPLGEGARPQGGWYDDLLLIVGEEISTYDGHILAVGIPPHRYQLAPGARAAIGDIEELGGWGWIAHPHHPDELWQAGWAGLDGVELINLAEAWARTPWSRRLAIAAAYPFSSDYALLRILSAGLPSLAVWDSRISLSPREDGRWPRPLVGIGAADAHGPIAWPAPLPRYADALSAVQTIVWLDIPPVSGPYDAEGAVLDALRHGRAAAVVSAIGDAGGFVYEARAPEADLVAQSGDLAPWEEGPWTLRAGVDVAGDISIVCLRDGLPVHTAAGSTLEYTPSQPGTYRIEVHRLDGPQTGPNGNIPWVISNPIYLWPRAARRAAVLRRVPPLPAPTVSDRLHSWRRWRAESSDDVSSVLDTDGERPEWSFELPEERTDETYTALAWRPRAPEDWSERDGLVFRLEAADEMRFVVELRAETADGETVSWYNSVKLDNERRTLVLPWFQWRQRSVDPRTASRLRRGYGLRALAGNAPAPEDLRRVTGLFLVVTPEILEPGSSERVTVREVGLYGG